ncbi:MAG: Fic family protein [Nitrospinae bacterium]|nr:Fic family protein [Nitrospinota bacterium]
MAPVHYHEGRFPPEKSLDWGALVPLLGPAVAALARYDGVLAAIPNPGVLLSPLTTQEAVLSSRIEGTQATMGEVLEFEAGEEVGSPDRRGDIEEIRNYRAAMRQAENMLETLPLSGRVVREAHRVLLSGVRGRNRSPGEYRRIPNWIGPPGCEIDAAKFVPIGVEKLDEAMSTWEHYIHQDTPDLLVQTAVLHAEFEALHPFLDGNGRLGRMLVPLFLWQRRLISRPMFYISAYFEAHRDAYYDGLLAVSRDDDWTGWCKFFLEGVRVQAEDNLAKARAILDLYEDMKIRMAELTRSRYYVHALDWIFERPIFRSIDFVNTAGIPEPTARRVLRVLRQNEVLSVIRSGGGRRSPILSFPDLLNTAEGKKLF